MAEERTLYVQVDYIDAKKVPHKRGESVKYPVSDTEATELVRRGVLSSKPVRRAAGESGGRSRKGDKG